VTSPQKFDMAGPLDAKESAQSKNIEHCEGEQAADDDPYSLQWEKITPSTSNQDYFGAGPPFRANRY